MDTEIGRLASLCISEMDLMRHILVAMVATQASTGVEGWYAQVHPVCSQHIFLDIAQIWMGKTLGRGLSYIS